MADFKVIFNLDKHEKFAMAGFLLLFLGNISLYLFNAQKSSESLPRAWFDLIHIGKLYFKGWG